MCTVTAVGGRYPIEAFDAVPQTGRLPRATFHCGGQPGPRATFGSGGLESPSAVAILQTGWFARIAFRRPVER